MDKSSFRKIALIAGIVGFAALFVVSAHAQIAPTPTLNSAEKRQQSVNKAVRNDIQRKNYAVSAQNASRLQAQGSPIPFMNQGPNTTPLIPTTSVPPDPYGVLGGVAPWPYFPLWPPETDDDTFPDGSDDPLVSSDPCASLAEQRKRFAEELKDPAVKAKFVQVICGEVGSYSEEQRMALIESAMNRASSRNQSLNRALDPVGKGGYYATRTFTHNCAGKNYDKEIEAVLAGSNVSQFATGNNGNHDGIGWNGGYETIRFSSERYGVEGPDKKWADKAKNGCAPGAGGATAGTP